MVTCAGPSFCRNGCWVCAGGTLVSQFVKDNLIPHVLAEINKLQPTRSEGEVGGEGEIQGHGQSFMHVCQAFLLM